MDETRTLPSGIELVVKLADFPDGHRLFKAVLTELKAISLDVDKIDLNADLTKLDPKMFNTLKNVFCQLLSSETVEKALISCMLRCLYDGQQLKMSAFNQANAREDFLPVAWEVGRANLAPFFRGLNLKSLTASPTPTGSPP